MTSIQQRDAQSVLAAIDDLLPQLRERAQETEDLRRLPDENVKALEDIGFFRLLQPEQWGGLQCDPTLFYEAVRRIASACGSTGWVAVDHRRAQLAPGAVRPAGPGGRLGRGHRRPDLVVLRADGRRRGRRRRLHGQRLVELVVGLRPRHLGVPRRSGDQGRQARRLRQLPDPAHRVPHRRRLARGRPARHRQQHRRGQGRLRAAAPVPVLQGDERPHRRRLREQHRAGLQDALGHNASHHHLGADRRAWPTAPTTRTSSTRASGSARRSPARRPRTTRSPRSGSPRRPATSTPRGGS